MIVFVTGGSGFLGGRLIRALRARGDNVRALARSEKSVRAVEAAGAEAVRGDLDDRGILDSALRSVDLVFHCAAKAEEWGPVEEFEAVNVAGTANVARAARLAKVRLVHVSTEAVLAGRPIIEVDEAAQPPEHPVGHYARTKRDAEEVVRRALGEGLDAVICRPRFIWGSGDENLLPKLLKRVRAGKFAWIGGGRHLTSTCHVANCVAGLLLAAERGRKGETYYLTDGKPIEFRAFLSDLFRASGVEPPQKSVPYWLANALAFTLEAIWRLLRLRSVPPVTRMAVLLAGQEVTVSDGKARRDLGYQPPMTREAGLAEVRASAAR